MKTYLGTKLILAVAMTRLAYNQYRQWGLPANENGADEGYLVEYTDGGKPNDSRHQGYISWSPKQVFEQAYKEIDINPEAFTLAPYQQRVVIEKAALDQKVSDLTTFLGSDFYKTLHETDQKLMSAQHLHMVTYSEILAKRIDRFSNSPI